jgi:hypothetical protein
MLALRLTHSRGAYPRPTVEKRTMIEAMAQAAADSQKTLA